MNSSQWSTSWGLASMIAVAFVVRLVMHWAKRRFPPTSRGNAYQGKFARLLVAFLLPTMAITLSLIGLFILLETSNGPPRIDVLVFVMYGLMLAGVAVPLAIARWLGGELGVAVIATVEQQAGISIRGLCVVTLASSVFVVLLASYSQYRHIHP